MTRTAYKKKGIVCLLLLLVVAGLALFGACAATGEGGSSSPTEISDGSLPGISSSGGAEDAADSSSSSEPADDSAEDGADSSEGTTGGWGPIGDYEQKH